jgi:membrane associated rhomboid family serine protease
LRVPAYVAIGFWVVLQVAGAAFMLDDGVGWYAHLGGLVAGAILVFPMRRRFDPLLARAEAQELRALR